LAAGAAATTIGSKLLGNRMGPALGGHMLGNVMGGGKHGKHHKSSPIPIGGLVAGAGAAALGAAVLTGHHPVMICFVF
jgi:hypothetical protein